MQLLSPSFAALLLAGAAIAQTNPFVVYPQDPERQNLTCTSFVGRPDMSARAEALMELDTEHFRGVGDSNGLVRLFGVYHWILDERMSTVETYDLVVRDGDPSGPGPDMSPGAEFLRISGLTSPPSTYQGRGTWIMNDGFGLAAGLIIVPTDLQLLAPARYYVGLDLPANPLWPTSDGHALWRADLLNAGTQSVFGENHRAGIPNPTWAGRTTAPSFSTPWTYVLGPLVTSPNLHLGGLDPTSNRLGAPGANFSMNGLFPDISGQPRLDGLRLRVTDNIAPTGIVLLGGSLGFQSPYFEWSLLGTLIGYSFVGDAGSPPTALGFAALVNGQYETTLATPGSIGPSMIGTDFALQAIVWDPITDLAEWTNAQEVHL